MTLELVHPGQMCKVERSWMRHANLRVRQFGHKKRSGQKEEVSE